jgi:hypothetical protein
MLRNSMAFLTGEITGEKLCVFPAKDLPRCGILAHFTRNAQKACL